MPRIALLVGRERTFPDALIAEVTRRKTGVSCEYAKLEATTSTRRRPTTSSSTASRTT